MHLSKHISIHLLLYVAAVHRYRHANVSAIPCSECTRLLSLFMQMLFLNSIPFLDHSSFGRRA